MSGPACRHAGSPLAAKTDSPWTTLGRPLVNPDFRAVKGGRSIRRWHVGGFPSHCVANCKPGGVLSMAPRPGFAFGAGGPNLRCVHFWTYAAVETA
jgi:hypothetical protein